MTHRAQQKISKNWLNFERYSYFSQKCLSRRVEHFCENFFTKVQISRVLPNLTSNRLWNSMCLLVTHRAQQRISKKFAQLWNTFTFFTKVLISPSWAHLSKFCQIRLNFQWYLHFPQKCLSRRVEHFCENLVKYSLFHKSAFLTELSTFLKIWSQKANFLQLCWNELQIVYCDTPCPTKNFKKFPQLWKTFTFFTIVLISPSWALL